MLFYILLAYLISSVNAHSPLASREIANSRSVAADYLLPNNVRPILYQVELEPDFVTDTFRGSINITLSITSTGNNVTLHTLELDIDVSDISLLDENGDIVNSVSSISYSNDDRQFYTITFSEDLEEGDVYILMIESFTGILNNNNNGLYLARYTNEDGVVRKLATTHFQHTFARRAFPCFDEPALKAEFDISIVRTEEYHSISNTPLISTEQLSNRRYRDVYARTPKMSTYLVALVVSDFTFVADQNQRVFGRPQLISEGRGNFSLNTGINMLDILEEYLGVPYTLSKMDQVGIPEGYFAMGAMENWGLVIYRESYLMFSSVQGTAEIIAHEYAHQWFGNIVTPTWWSYLWLNEGFATYFEFFAASIEQNFDFVDRIVTTAVQYALAIDSSMSTRPMNQDAGSPNDIRSLFDMIAYYKSGAVIRMAQGILSEEAFQRGLNIYLKRMEFAAAQPADLYSCWQEALSGSDAYPLPSGEDVESVMTTWDSNAGYPLLTVSRNYTDGSVTFSQRRFLSSNPENDDATIWYVPISYATQSNPNFSDSTPRVWLTDRSTTVDLYDLQQEDWIIVNIQQSGYYRINYDNDNWYRIIDFLGGANSDQIHRINKAQMIDDSFELARAGVISYDIVLGLWQYLIQETEYAPLQSFVNSLSFLDSQLVHTDVYGKFKAYVLETLKTAFEALELNEVENDSVITKLNRRNVITWMCLYGHEVCQQFALEQFREWKRDESYAISSYLQIPLICTALKMGVQSDSEFVFERYIMEADPARRTNMLSSLGCSENKIILNRYLTIILDAGNDLTLSDRLAALSTISTSGNYGRTYISNYLRDNWSLLNKRFSPPELVSIISEIGSRLSTHVQLAEMEHLALQFNAESTFEDGLENLRSNVIWAEKYLPTITTWLNKRY